MITIRTTARPSGLGALQEQPRRDAGRPARARPVTPGGPAGAAPLQLEFTDVLNLLHVLH